MTQKENTVTVKLSGRIDSTNSAGVESAVMKQLEGITDTVITLDSEELEYISSAGLRVILRLKKTWPDLRIINVSPEVYGETPLEGLIAVCEGRDRMEAIVLRKAIDEDKPLFGICRGIQYVNVALGGTLYQDLDLQHPSDIEHHQQPPYDVPIHEVTVLKESPLYACLQKEQLGVNSYHHQAIKDLAPGLKEMAVSPDGLIEAVYMPGHRFLWAVQWHPEFFGTKDADSRNIFHAFADAMK